MRRIALLVGLLAAFAAGRLGVAGEPAAPDVAAQRYRIIWCEGSCDLAHGGGRWVQEFFLPETKVVGTLVYEDVPWDPATPGTLGARRPCLYARHAAKPRNDFTGLHEPKPSTIEDVRIPADLAKEILAQAELTERREAEGLRVGTAVADRLGLKPLD